MNSRDKGARGEREAAKALTDLGWPSVRDGQQGAGGKDHHDLNHSLPGHHIEVKRVEAFSCVTRAMEQAKKDAAGLVPVVMSP